ncbi:STAS domain-containing protein [Pengzhenrongella frigida]|uniref:STAS domain-containing protein n=1 Tax=Pengzhenrongella frigida TaxID=1259133 RepID=A0A4Q5MX75_9MICO|nr:STAS domain-containing protein [Cellulomonas sp. HLT2-17]RYV50219.1 STAS domain-containing protein [Cellulomonas sp. HLT2-17]
MSTTTDDGVPVPTQAGPARGGVVVIASEDRVRVSFWGVVDADVRSQFVAPLWTNPTPGRPCEIDCREVTLMDSIGLSVFVRLVQDAIAEAQDVQFLGASSQVADLLETTGVEAWMRHLGVRIV